MSFPPAENAEQLLRTLESVEIESCSFRSPCIVIIIGESFSKHHSSLYGYPLPTNPRLEERLRRGELFVFRDVVSPANLTTSVLSNLFSPASLGSGQSWKTAPFSRPSSKKPDTPPVTWTTRPPETTMITTISD